MRWRPRDPDLLIVLAFFAFGLLDRTVAPGAEGSVLANVAGAAAMSVPFYWRRTHPLAFIVALVGGAVLNDVIATPTDEVFSALAVLMTVGFTLVRNQEGRARWLPLAIAYASVGAAEGYYGAGDVFFVWLLITGGAIGGWLLRSRAALTRELAERTHELEALREKRERDAVLDERRRIARELHDVVAHTVSVMVVQAGGARAQLRRDPQRALAAMDQVDATGHEALIELERLFGLLHTTAATGLADVPELADRAGLPVEVEVHGTPVALSADADLAAYRLVQEALTNTIKHGGPGATAHVAIAWGDDAVDIRVTDTGSGLDGDGPPAPGSRRGLIGMHERMSAVGGTVEAGPGQSGGFEVRARLPVAVEAAA